MKMIVLICYLIGAIATGSNAQNNEGVKVGSLRTFQYEVRGEVYALSKSQIRISGFNYNGRGPDAFFYVGTTDDSPSRQGQKIPDEKGTMDILGRYVNKDIILTMPANINVEDIRWLSVWCRAYSVNFGSLNFPENLDLTSDPVPRARQIGKFTTRAHGLKSGTITILDSKTVSIEDLHYDGAGPDAYFFVGKMPISHTTATKVADENGSYGVLKGYQGKDITLTLPGNTTFDDVEYLSMYCVRFTQNFGEVMIPADLNVPVLVEKEAEMPNCERLHDYMNVAWEINEDNITVELHGALDGEDGYMAFGLSGADDKSSMSQADVLVGHYKDSPEAVDYHLGGYSLCAGDTGVCPDTTSNGANDWTLLSADFTSGITTIKSARKLDTGDSKDKVFRTDEAMYIVWAMGHLNELTMVTKHDLRLNGNKQLHFGRPNSQNCPNLKARKNEELSSWKPSVLFGSSTTTFRAQIGPSGGSRGYTPITGRQSWGIAWYINEMLIPEIFVKRGENYTFIVEGGNDVSNNAKHHPFYITNDNVGGYSLKTDAEKVGISIYAGPKSGRYCEWEHQTIDRSSEFDKFEDFFKTLNLTCADGSPGTFDWTPDENTPDLVYYQCYTHNFLGWKIHVVDEYPQFAAAACNNYHCAMLYNIYLAIFLGTYFVR